jgi:ribosomal protein L2
MIEASAEAMNPDDHPVGEGAVTSHERGICGCPNSLLR